MADIVEIFAGCGGLSLGAIQAGHRIIRAYDFDAAACEAYPRVTGHDVIEQADLTRFDLSSLPTSAGIIGGPPCQEFSTAGKYEGHTGKRNLWPAAIEAIRLKRPLWFVFENVKGLVAPAHRRYFDSILWALRDFGYNVDWRLLNAADYGVPQTRERVFVVGWRDDRRWWSWPTPTHGPESTMFEKRWVGVNSALADWLKGDKRPTEITPWLTHRYPDGLPDNVYFGHQQSMGGKCHRYLDEPAFTIDASHSCFKIRVDGKAWIVDRRALAKLQTFPPVDLHRKLIGNAVPPLLARALLSEVA